MKHLIIALLIIIGSNYSWADSWDNLTKEQAEETVRFLEANPFVFDYCDCCDQGGEVLLLRITSLEIVTCDWDNNYFSVAYTAHVIAGFPSGERGIEVNRITDLEMDSDELSGKVSMNYTWGYNKDNRNVNPILSMVPYDVYGTDYSPCLNAFGLPSPKLVKDKQYKKWFKKL